MTKRDRAKLKRLLEQDPLPDLNDGADVDACLRCHNGMTVGYWAEREAPFLCDSCAQEVLIEVPGLLAYIDQLERRLKTLVSRPGTTRP